MNRPPFLQRLRAVAPMVMLVLLAAAVSGCTSVKRQTKKMVDAIPFTGERLRKKVAIIPFENTTFIPDPELRQLFMNRFLELLAADCSTVVWLTPGDAGYPDALARAPRLASGRVDNLALAEIGRASGINAFLLGKAVSLDAEEKEKGFFIFRDTHYYESAQIAFQIHDSGTGAKLLDETLTESVEVDGAEFDAILAKDLKAMYELSQTMDRISAAGAEKVCETLGKHPWQGYVVSVQDGTVTLSAGREIGMKTGDVLTVYGIGEVIEGKLGQRFIVPGTPTGKLEITAVEDGLAQGRPLEETTVAEGYTVRLD